jgi:Zn-dependent protease with chaperone function
MYRILLLGRCVHVTPKQCPKIYKLFKEACDILDMHEPDLFLMNNPQANAFTFGVERPFIVVHSGLIDLMDEDELLAVLGHELGHIKAGHSLYKTIAYFLARMAEKFLGGQLYSMALAIALFEWSRKSELTADRAELLVCQDVDVSMRVHMKLAAGTTTVYDQMDEPDMYEELDHSTLNKVYKLFQELGLTHPLPVFRSKETMAWSKSKQYQEIMAGRYPTEEVAPTLRTCPHCQSKISPSFFFCPDCGKNARV